MLRSRGLWLAGVTAAVLVSTPVSVVGAQPAAEPLRVVSSRPQTVSGDTALVQLTVPDGARWKARLNGRA
jgi:hypothetical protein